MSLYATIHGREVAILFSATPDALLRRHYVSSLLYFVYGHFLLPAYIFHYAELVLPLSLETEPRADIG